MSERNRRETGVDQLCNTTKKFELTNVKYKKPASLYGPQGKI